MGDLLIRNVPESVKRAVEQAARRDGRSLSATAIDLLRKSLFDGSPDRDRRKSAWEEMRPLFYDVTEDEAEEFARTMEDVEAERKRDFGRAVPEPGA